MATIMATMNNPAWLRTGTVPTKAGEFADKTSYVVLQQVDGTLNRKGAFL